MAVAAPLAAARDGRHGMAQAWYCMLDERGVLAVGGPDARDFLQGIISNDVGLVGPQRAIWSALLTPQGKFLHEFFITEHDGRLLLDCEAGRRDDLRRRLGAYRLRSRVTIDDAAGGFAVAAAFGPGALAALGVPDTPGAARELPVGVAHVDPRLVELGARLVLRADAATAALHPLALAPAPAEAWHRLRIGLGVPDGSRDMTVEKAILLENGFDELHGIAWDKGCYVGQELTARTRYRGLIRRRLLPVAIDGPPPPPGAPVLSGEREAGELRSIGDGIGLALLRVDALSAAEPLTAGAARLRPVRPGWVRL